MVDEHFDADETAEWASARAWELADAAVEDLNCGKKKEGLVIHELQEWKQQFVTGYVMTIKCDPVA